MAHPAERHARPREGRTTSNTIHSSQGRGVANNGAPGADRVQIGTRRAVAEWIGAHPDSVPPPHVRLRIFERCDGVCHISGRKIRAGEPWDAEHIKPLWDGGENRETNLAPALADKHRRKTAQEATERSDGRRKKSKHFGIKTKSPGFSAWRKFDGTIVRRDRT
jgi:5-methylcytosine-specific restriction enzyme A